MERCNRVLDPRPRALPTTRSAVSSSPATNTVSGYGARISIMLPPAPIG